MTETIPEDIREMALRVATQIAGLVANNADARLVETDGAIGIAIALLAERGAQKERSADAAWEYLHADFNDWGQLPDNVADAIRKHGL